MSEREYDLRHEITFIASCAKCGREFREKSLGLAAKVAKTHYETCACEHSAQDPCEGDRFYLDEAAHKAISECLATIRQVIIDSGRVNQETELTHYIEKEIEGGGAYEYLVYRVVLAVKGEADSE